MKSEAYSVEPVINAGVWIYNWGLEYKLILLYIFLYTDLKITQLRNVCTISANNCIKCGQSKIPAVKTMYMNKTICYQIVLPTSRPTY